MPTFTISGATLFSMSGDAYAGGVTPIQFAGDWSTVGIGGNNKSGSFTLVFAAGHSILATSAHGSSFIENPPVGFKPTTGLTGTTLSDCYLRGAADDVVVTFGTAQQHFTYPQGPGGVAAVSFPDNTGYVLLVTSILSVTAALEGAPFTAGSAVGCDSTSAVITGHYIIETWYFNWTTNHYELVDPATPPSAPWVPSYPDPVPVITDVVSPRTTRDGEVLTWGAPAEGCIGTEIQIYGSGFGDDLIVLIGGVLAASVVEDSTTITATVPTGTGSDLPVVVYNADGQSATYPNGFSYSIPWWVQTLTWSIDGEVVKTEYVYVQSCSPPVDGDWNLNTPPDPTDQPASIPPDYTSVSEPNGWYMAPGPTSIVTAATSEWVVAPGEQFDTETTPAQTDDGWFKS